MYLSEPGWRVGVKTGSDREFCYMRAPGQDFYHRLLDGEVFLQRDDEKLCLACASRRGLIVAEPKRLREAIIPLPADLDDAPSSSAGATSIARDRSRIVPSALDRIAAAWCCSSVRRPVRLPSSERSPSHCCRLAS